MSVKLILGSKLNFVSTHVVKSIKDNLKDFLCENIVVVPDRFSLVVEKMIFQNLNIKSTFNIHVMGINKLAKKIIDEAQLNCVYVDLQESEFILYRAFQKTKNKFCCFSKQISKGLLEKIKNALSLIRSSDISVENLEQNIKNLNENIQKKMQDLCLIYKEYENLLNQRLDATKVLKTFGAIIESTTSLKNKNIYFCGFDSFTKQGYEIIKKISKFCKNLSIGILVPSNNSNSNVFDTEMYTELKNYFLQQNIDFEEIKTKLELSKEQKCIFENVYGYNINNKENLNYANIVEMPSKTEEIENVAKRICYMTKNNICKFSDINIATNSSYFKEIETVFKQFNISYYIDENTEFSQIPIVNFLKYTFDFCVEDRSQESILNYLNNYFCNIEKQIKNEIENYVIENNIEFKKFDNLLKIYPQSKLMLLNDFYANIKSHGTVGEYIDMLNKYIDNCFLKEQIQELCLKFNKENNLKNEKIYIQVMEKLGNLNAKMKSILKDEKISFLEFCDLYLNALTKITISQVPLSLDCVYVGDCAKSFFETKNYLFVLGANQDILPISIKDSNLILDNEIESMPKSIRITPTAKMINKRNKFKLFDLLSDAKKQLCVYYSLTDDEGQKLMPSRFVTDMLKINAKKFTKANFEEFFVDDDFLKKLEFNNPTPLQALKHIAQNNQNSAIIKNALKIKNQFVDFNVPNKKNVEYGQKMLSLNKTKVSQIETYYECPFKHFLKYGIKIKEQKNGKIKANDFGNFLHEFCRLLTIYSKENLGKLDETHLLDIVDKIFFRLTSLSSFAILNDEENLFTKKILYNEVKRVAQFINYEQSKSLFKIKDAELKFGDGDGDLIIEVEGEKYSIVGIVDRVDKYKNYFRIIDYKTGSKASSNSKITNLYNGTKIQVYVYLKAIQNKYNLLPFGAFYLPLTNEFLEDKTDDYKMQGYFIDDIDLIEKADLNLNYENPKSKFFEVQLSTNTKYTNKNLKKLIYSKDVTKQELEAMINYSIEIVQQAIKEILKGNIALSPYDGSCMFCDYKAICGIDESSISERKIDFKIDPKTFLGENNE